MIQKNLEKRAGRWGEISITSSSSSSPSSP